MKEGIRLSDLIGIPRSVDLGVSWDTFTPTTTFCQYLPFFTGEGAKQVGSMERKVNIYGGSGNFNSNISEFSCKLCNANIHDLNFYTLYNEQIK